MTHKWRVGWLVACAATVAALASIAFTTAQEPQPPYVIRLRSRDAEVTPQHEKDAQTAGGFVEVLHRSPDSILLVMHGGVVAGSEKARTGMASMRFRIDQDFEIVATRPKLRAPRLSMVGTLVGTLQSSLYRGGNADQGPATAAINSGGLPVLSLALKPHGVTTGQRLLVNDRAGPFDAVVATGLYCVHEEFEIAANQPTNACVALYPAPGAAANFDPEPKFDARYSNILKAFRAVPHQDFGFTVLINVSEPGAHEVDLLPLPRPIEKSGPSPTLPSGPKKG